MKEEILKKNISNLENWLSQKPNDEDYKRLLSEYIELSNNINNS